MHAHEQLTCRACGPSQPLDLALQEPGSYPADLAHVCNLEALPPSDRDAVLATTDLGEAWGIGRRIGKQLKAEGLNSVLDVASMDPAMVCRRWGIVLERTVRELQGFACIELEDEPPLKKEIAAPAPLATRCGRCRI